MEGTGWLKWKGPEGCRKGPDGKDRMAEAERTRWLTEAEGADGRDQMAEGGRDWMAESGRDRMAEDGTRWKGEESKGMRQMSAV